MGLQEEDVYSYSSTLVHGWSVVDLFADLSIYKVRNTSNAVEDLGADSLDTFELVMALEEEFDTEIPDEEAEKMTTGKILLRLMFQYNPYLVDEILTSISTLQAAIDFINRHQG